MKNGVLLFVAGVVSGVGVLLLMEGGDLLEGKGGLPPVKGNSVRVSERDGGRSQSGRGSRSGEVRGHSDQGLGDLMGRVDFLRHSAWNETNQLELGRLTAVIGAMSGEDVDAFLLELEELEEDDMITDPLRRLSEVAMLRLFELDGFAAIKALRDGCYPNCDERFGSNMRASSMSVWAGQNPDGVRDLLMTFYKESEGGGSSVNGNLGGQFFLQDPDVMAAFFLSYERGRPGQSAELAGELKDKGTQDWFGRLSLKARIKLADHPAAVGKALDDSLDIVAYQAQAVLEEAMDKNLAVCQQWVEGQEESEHRNQALLDVGRQVIQGEAAEAGVDWLLSQEVSDVETRKLRLGLLRRELMQPVNIVITESRIEMPVFSTRKVVPLEVAPEIVDFEGFVNYGSPLNVNVDPQVADDSSPEELARELRNRAAGMFEGRFVEQIEAEIEALKGEW